MKLISFSRGKIAPRLAIKGVDGWCSFEPNDDAVLFKRRSVIRVNSTCRGVFLWYMLVHEIVHALIWIALGFNKKIHNWVQSIFHAVDYEVWKGWK